MFQKKEVVKANEEKAKKQTEKKDKVKAGSITSILKIVAIPVLLTAILVAGIYLVMDKMTEKEALLKPVVVATGQITENTYIKAEEVEEYFSSIQMDATLVAENAEISLSELKKQGFYVNDDMVENQILYSENIKKTDANLDKYKKGYEITSIAVSNFDKGVNGSLREGAIIDVYALDPETDELKCYAENLYVAAAYDSSGLLLTTDEGVAQSYTVYVKPKEVEELNRAINYGEIHIYQK